MFFEIEKVVKVETMCRVIHDSMSWFFTLMGIVALTLSAKNTTRCKYIVFWPYEYIKN